MVISMYSLSEESIDNSHLYFGSTCVNLFDDKLVLKKGSYLLMFWPFHKPSSESNYTSPAEVSDDFYRIIVDSHFNEQKFIKTKNVERTSDLTEISMINKGLTINQIMAMLFLETKFEIVNNKSMKMIYMPLPRSFPDLDYSISSITKYTPVDSINFLINTNKYKMFVFEESEDSDLLQVRDYDFDISNEDDIVQQMYYANLVESELKLEIPKGQEKDRLSKTMLKPNFVQLSNIEKLLVYKYRTYLQENPSALPKYLLSVYWTIEKNIEDNLKLIKRWACLKYDDILFLLSGYFCGNDVYPARSVNQVKYTIRSKIDSVEKN